MTETVIFILAFMNIGLGSLIMWRRPLRKRLLFTALTSSLLIFFIPILTQPIWNHEITTGHERNNFEESVQTVSILPHAVSSSLTFIFLMGPGWAVFFLGPSYFAGLLVIRRSDKSGEPIR